MNSVSFHHTGLGRTDLKVFGRLSLALRDSNFKKRLGTLKDQRAHLGAVLHRREESVLGAQPHGEVMRMMAQVCPLAGRRVGPLISIWTT